MEKDFLTISETELQQFEKKMKNAGIIRENEKLDKVHLVLLYKLFQAEKRISSLEKHIMTPLIH
jgi:hypothetical protein